MSTNAYNQGSQLWDGVFMPGWDQGPPSIAGVRTVQDSGGGGDTGLGRGNGNQGHAAGSGGGGGKSGYRKFIDSNGCIVTGGPALCFGPMGLEAGAEELGVTVIGKLEALDVMPGERTLLSQLPDLSSPGANWAQNASVLRRIMSLGQPIRDASVDAEGNLIDNTGFLRAERNLLQNHGWSYDSSTTMWYPPGP